MEIKIYNKYEDFESVPAGTQDVNIEGNADDFFYLKMEDDSMSPDYEEGQLILFKKQRKAKSGEVVFVTVGNSSYIRKIWYDKDFLNLIPIHENYDKLEFTGFSLNRVKIKGVAQ